MAVGARGRSGRWSSLRPRPCVIFVCVAFPQMPSCRRNVALVEGYIVLRRLAHTGSAAVRHWRCAPSWRSVIFCTLRATGSQVALFNRLSLGAVGVPVKDAACYRQNGIIGVVEQFSCLSPFANKCMRCQRRLQHTRCLVRAREVMPRALLGPWGQPR